jgi:hypothetical protein
MNWASTDSLDQLWRSPDFPMWVTLAAAGFFALILLFTLLRAEKSVANGALTVITLLAVGIAVAATVRGPLARTTSASIERHPAAATTTVALPSLSCVEDIAGDAVAAACEKAVFASADATAAAVNHMAQMITRLTSLGDASTAQKAMTPDLQGLRRAIERDRYGLVAQVLLARDRCTPTQCPAFRSLTDNHQIITNMDEHAYDALVSRYAAAWNAAPPMSAAGAVAMLPPSMPSGRPTNAEFPSASSTPPVSIMTPEPSISAQRPPAPAPSPPKATPAPAEAKPAAPTPASAKKQTAQKKPAAPTSLTPPPGAPAAPAGGASED